MTSLKMAPIDRSCMTYHWFASVSIALYLLPFSSYWILKNIVTLKTRLRVAQRHRIVTVAICCNVCATKQDRSQIPLFTPLPFNFYDHLEPFEFLSIILTQNARVPKLLRGAKFAGKFKPLIRVECTKVTDRRQTE